MKLTILGSGTCVPSVERGSPSNLLEIGEIKILLDIGAGSLRQLAKVNQKLYQQIDIVFLSHHHTDHISDFSALIQALNWTPGFTRKKTLYIIAHPSIEKIIDGVIKKSITFKTKFLAPRKKDKIKNINFEVTPGNHEKTSLILKIKYRDKTLVYSADTDYDPKISKFAKGCDLLILENSFPEKIKEVGHLNSKLSAEMANIAQAKKLLLTHFYPPCEKYDIKKQAQKYFKGPIILAKDLMTIKV